ncbi:hypothetical protein GCM10025857_35500 [Alicyclobacillus contaminans]|nr:hypothetical protein GCM10025857_35500 [Alicyclobacillus contaminans]
MHVLRVWALNVFSSVFQILLTGVLGVCVFYVGGFNLGLIIWMITGDGNEGVVLAPILSAILSYVLYAIGWFLFWYALRQLGEREWLYTRIFFGWIPLIVFTVCYRPAPPDPTAMQLVNMPSSFIFSTFATATILFPMYCIWLNRYVLEPEVRRKRKGAVYAGFFGLISLGESFIPWHGMPPA